MRKLIRFRWPLSERGRGKRKDSCYIEPIEIASTLSAKHCGDQTSDCSNGVLIYDVPCKVVKPYGTKGGLGAISIIPNTEDLASTIAARDSKGIYRHLGDAIMEIRAVCTPDYEEKHQNGRRIKDEGEPMFTVTAQDRHGVAIYPSLKIKEATAKGYAEAKVGDGVNLSNPNSNTRRGRVGDGIVNTLTCDNQMGVVVNNLPLAYDEQNSTLRKDGTVGTLTTDGSSSKHNNRVIVGNNQVRIRRLTPREVWRLQGFPDEYFDKAKYKKKTIYLIGGEDKCCAKLKVVTEKPKLFDMETYALCTTKDLLGMEMSTMMGKPSENEHLDENMLNVSIVMIKSARVEHLVCATNIIKCIDFMGMHCTMIKNLGERVTDIIVQVKQPKANTEKCMKITTMYNLPLNKLYTILILLKLIIELKIFTSTTLKANMQGFMHCTQDSEGNILLKISSLEMEHIMQRISDTELYKAAGNAVTVNVARAIGKKLKEIEDEETENECSY